MVTFGEIVEGTVITSHDKKRVACVTNRDDKWLVMVDGLRGKEYDGIGRGSLVFSPDATKMAYQAKRGDKWLVVVDEVEYRVVHPGGGDSIGAIQNVRALRIASGEVGDDTAVVDHHSEAHPILHGRIAGVLHVVLEGVLTVRNGPQLFAHPALSVILKLGADGVNPLQPVGVEQLVDALFSDVQ